MTILAIEGAVLRIAGRLVLDGADLAVAPGRKIGLVGRNGAGKSSLLRAVLGEVALDGRTIRLARGIRLAAVAQTAPSGEASLLDTVLAADAERSRLLAEAEQATPDRLGEIHDRLRAIGAGSAPARAAAILSGLGFDPQAQRRPLSAFSGGWRMRVALAAALFLEPDLLLLDEPTNHLDLEAALWLEAWLARFAGAAIIVSHDRTLLDRAVDAIAHLDRGRIALYPGGFSAFVRSREERAVREAAVAERVARERARLKAFVDRFRAKATKARQAQSRLKAIARLPAIDAMVEETPTRFSFPAPAPLAPPLLALDRVSVGYEGRPVLRGVSLRLDADDRIALLGRNGNGKSTLAKLLAGRLEPLSGSLFRTPRLSVGYFAQHQEEELVRTETPIEHLSRALPQAPPAQLRAQLARFGLDADRAETAVAALSGGERARLLLALATRHAPQLLILDEPTNHLDLDAREALVRALADYEGAVVLITHDPHVVALVADRLLLVADGTVRPYEGDLDEYRRFVTEQERAPLPREEEGSKRAEERRARAETRAALAPLRKRIAEVEAEIARLSAERVRLESALADPALYAGKGRAETIAAHGARLAEVRRALAVAEEAWIQASEDLEAAAARA